MSEVSTGFLRGFMGEKSSKRLMVMISFFFFMLFVTALFSTAMFGFAKDSNITIKVIEILGGFIAVLAGFGTAEIFKKG